MISEMTSRFRLPARSYVAHKNDIRIIEKKLPLFISGMDALDWLLNIYAFIFFLFVSRSESRCGCINIWYQGYLTGCIGLLRSVGNYN